MGKGTMRGMVRKWKKLLSSGLLHHATEELDHLHFSPEDEGTASSFETLETTRPHGVATRTTTFAV